MELHFKFKLVLIRRQFCFCSYGCLSHVYIFILKLSSTLRVIFGCFRPLNAFAADKCGCLITENVNEEFIHALYIIFIMNALVI